MRDDSREIRRSNDAEPLADASKCCYANLTAEDTGKRERYGAIVRAKGHSLVDPVELGAHCPNLDELVVTIQDTAEKNNIVQVYNNKRVRSSKSADLKGESHQKVQCGVSLHTQTSKNNGPLVAQEQQQVRRASADAHDIHTTLTQIG
jgi:hypothetical protein